MRVFKSSELESSVVVPSALTYSSDLIVLGSICCISCCGINVVSTHSTESDNLFSVLHSTEQLWPAAKNFLSLNKSSNVFSSGVSFVNESGLAENA